MDIRRENIPQTQTMRRVFNPVSGFDHWHQRAEFMYVLAGQCSIRIGSREQLCNPGDLAVIRSGQIHKLYSSPGCTLYISTFDPIILFHFLPELRFPRSFITAREQEEAGLAEEILRLLDDIYRETVERHALYETLIRSNILKL